MKRGEAVFLIFGLTLGFFTHLLLDKLYRENAAVNIVQNKVLGKTAIDEFITRVSFNGKSFSPDAVTVKGGNYLEIENNSEEKTMWLYSDTPELNTVRPYAYKEALKINLTKEGLHKAVNREGFGELTVHVIGEN